VRVITSTDLRGRDELGEEEAPHCLGEHQQPGAGQPLRRVRDEELEDPDHRRLALLHQQVADAAGLGFGRSVASELEAPNTLAIPV
jgi:hypothetical protein